MDADAKKTALRMIPYGLYVLTAGTPSGPVAASTVNWVTQCSFVPPLVAVGVKVDSGAHALLEATGLFALNVLGKDQGALAYTFFKSLQREGDTIGGQPFVFGAAGAPLLTAAPAWIACRRVDTVTRGDHALFVGEVVEAGVRTPPAGRPDDATLWLRELGEKVFYGG